VDVEAWLDGLGLGRYARAFAENDIDRETLATLTAEDLMELGVGSLGHRKRLLAAIGMLAPATVVAGADPLAAAPGEHRQVAMVFADLCGFTTLSRTLDAEDLHDLISRVFERLDAVVGDYGGSVDKHIGDAVMSLFGAPIAHDDDVLRAVHAAREMHAAMATLSDELGRPLALHIGIACGDVVAGGMGEGGDYSVVGLSVNLAARLCALAGPGETLISDDVYRRIADKVDCQALAEVAVKGFDQPVRPWRLGAGETAVALSRHGPFVGRRGELAQLTSILETTLRDGRGHAVCLRGEAGIGKSRLVDELAAIAEAKGFTRHKTLVLDFGAGKGRDAIRALLRSFLAIAPGEGKDARREAAERALADGRIGEDERVFLNDLLDLPQPTALAALYGAMEPEARDRGKRALVAALLSDAASKGPVLVAVEDVHWAERPTLAYLAALAQAIEPVPVLLVMTTRVEGDPLDAAWRASAGAVSLATIDLGPLRAEEAQVLAQGLIASSTQVARRCIERAGGNPLFLDQLLRNAEEGGEEAVPGSIKSLILARMDRLDAPDREALQAAAVIGQRFALDSLRHLIDRPGYAIDPLVEHHLVRPEGADYLFVHALIRDGVYASLLRVRARELHGRAAAWFADHDPTLRAQHLERAGDAAAACAYLDAAQAQAAQYRFQRANELIERGLATADAASDRFALTLLKGEILHDLGDSELSIAIYRDALALAPDETGRCRALIGLAAGMRVTDAYDDAFAALDKAQGLAEAQGLDDDLSRLHHLRGNLLFPLGRIETCAAEHERALDYAREADSAASEARALSGLGDAAYASGRLITAHGYFERCVDLCRRHGLGRIEVANRPMIAHTVHYFEPGFTAVELGLAAVAAARKVGHMRAEMNANIVLYMALYDLRRFDEVRAHIRRGHEIVKRIGAWRFESPNLRFESRLRHHDGDHDGARAIAVEAVEVCRRTGIGFDGPRTLASLALVTPDADERRRALDEGEKLLAEGAVGHNHLWFYRDAIDAGLDSGDWDEAERYAAALEAFTADEPLPWSDVFIARARALARFGQGERGAAIAEALDRVHDECLRYGLIVVAKAVADARDANRAEPKSEAVSGGT